MQQDLFPGMKAIYRLLFSSVMLIASACTSGPTMSDAGSSTVTGGAHHADKSANSSAYSLDEDVVYGVLAGEIAGQRGRMDVAVRQYLYAARLARDPRMAERASRIAIYAGDNEGARAALELLAEFEPDNIEAHQLAGVLELRARRVESALVHFERVLELAPGGEGRGFLKLTRLLSKEKSRPEILTAATQLSQRHPDVAEGHYMVGTLAAAAGDLAMASDALKRSIVLRPGWEPAIILRAQTMVRLGQAPQALTLLENAVKENPRAFALRMSLAQLLVQIDQPGRARDEFATLLEQRPESSDVLYALGLLSVQLQQLGDARRYFEQLYANKERSQDAAYYLGQLDESEGNYDDALEWYELITSGSHHLDAKLRHAMLVAQLGRIDDAREELDSLRTAMPDQAQRLYLAEGELLRQSGKYSAAIKLYTQALNETPGNPDLLYARALTAEKLDRLDLLETDLKQILKTDPDNANALNALGYTLADRTDRLAEARLYIVQALELMPNNASVMDSMGWLEYRAGNYDAAVKYLRQALEIERDGEIVSHLVAVLRAKGDLAGAQQMLEHALTDFPDDEYLLEAARQDK